VGAGSFQIRDINLSGGTQSIYARNAVLSNIQDVQSNSDMGIFLDNSFMVSLRSYYGGGTNLLTINGGMRSTVENEDATGGNAFGYRSWGTDHANFASRYEVQLNAGVDVGVDQFGTPQPSIGFSLAGLEEEANSTGVRLTKCQNCSITSSQIYGHGIQGFGPNGTDGPDYYGLYVDDAHNTTISGMSSGGYFWTSDIAITGKASNNLITDFRSTQRVGRMPTGLHESEFDDMAD